MAAAAVAGAEVDAGRVPVLSGHRLPGRPGPAPRACGSVEAVGRAADEQITLAIGQRNEAVEHAAAEAEQARCEAERARAAETEVRAELDRVRADARQAVAQALADAARERDEMRAWSEGQTGSMRTEFAQAREDADRLVGQVREDAAARIAALEADRAGLREERDRLAGELRAAARQPRRGNGDPVREGQARRVRRDGPTKRDRMIELAGQRRDLAAVPLAEVSRLASTVAAEIGYSPGTARRELARHVRELQGAPADSTPDSGGGQAR